MDLLVVFVFPPSHGNKMNTRWNKDGLPSREITLSTGIKTQSQCRFACLNLEDGTDRLSQNNAK